MKLCMGCMNNIEENVQVCPHCGYNEAADEREAYYLEPGTVVGGKYIVGKALSYGGFFVSYIGMDAEQNRKVTIKEYLPSDFTTRSEGEKEITIYSGDALEQFEEGLDTFLNEGNQIQNLGMLPGIASVYDCIAENDTGYLISEYVEGQTLKELLDAGKTFTAKETYEFACTILTGLAKLHKVNVIHCDIAPENIVWASNGQIKLIDFGAIRYATTSNSKSLAVILKQGYAPEEQYRSRGEKGPWSDVYSVAAVMYRMLTGKVPTESVERALTDKLQEPSRLGIELPSNMENAMMNALNVFQSDRTPSAEAFLAELSSKTVKRNKVKIKSDTGKFPLWAKGLVAGLLAIAVVGGIFVLNHIQSDVEVTENKDNISMVSVIGKSLEEAQGVLKDKGVAEPTIVYNLGEQSEIVTLQTPNAGSIIQKDSEITLFVKNDTRLTLGGEGVDVINISAKKIEDLRKQLNKIGITDIKTKEEGSPDKRRGNLIRIEENDAEFPYGTYVEAGRTLTLVISTGSKAKKPQAVVNYCGKKYADIKNNDDYKIKYVNEADNCVPEPMRAFGDGSGYGLGVIAHQTIPAGQEYSNKKFALYEIHEIVSSEGKDVKQFKAELEQNGFENISLENVVSGDTDFKWKITEDPGMEGMENETNHRKCFSSDAKIVIYKDPPTPKPVVTNNNNNTTTGGNNGNNTANSTTLGEVTATSKPDKNDGNSSNKDKNSDKNDGNVGEDGNISEKGDPK